MKKVIVCILLLALLLPGCHGARSLDAFQMPESFDTSRNYEVVFWAKNDTNITQVNIYKQAIADFEALYPNIKVKLKLYTKYPDIYSDVITNIRTGTPPDVCITYPDHIATYMEGKNVVVPLDALLTDEKYGLGGSELAYDGPDAQEMVDKFMQECMLADRYYAIPFMRSTEACYVNKTYVEKLGFTLPEKLTWDFIWEVSDAAAAKDENGKYLLNGGDVMIPLIYKSTDNMMIQMLRQLGADYSTGDGQIGIFNEDTQQILYTVADHVKKDAFSTFSISGYPANFLNAGQCVFAVDSTAGATWMGSDAPLIDIDAEKVVDFETVVMEIPQFDTQNPQMISQGPSVCVFNDEDPQQVLASWLFAQYLLTDDVQISYAQTEGYVPVTQKAQNSDRYQDYLNRAGQDNDLHYQIKLDATKLLLENTENTFVTPVFNGSASLRSAAGELIEQTVKAARRKQTVDDAFLQELFTQTRYQMAVGIRSADTQLGPLPSGAVWLLGALGTCWLCLGAVFLVKKTWEKRK